MVKVMKQKRSFIFWVFKIMINPVCLIVGMFFENGGDVFGNERIESIEKKMKEKLWFSILIKGILIIVFLLIVLLVYAIVYVVTK